MVKMLFVLYQTGLLLDSYAIGIQKRMEHPLEFSLNTLGALLRKQIAIPVDIIRMIAFCLCTLIFVTTLLIICGRSAKPRQYTYSTRKENLQL